MEQPLERLRAICLALPETTERLNHDEPTFFVRGKKVFATYADHHHDDRLSFWCHAPAGSQQSLVAADPQRYFVPPYVGGRGWVGVHLEFGEELATANDDDTVRLWYRPAGWCTPWPSIAAGCGRSRSAPTAP